jgi:hypothetical protein
MADAVTATPRKLWQHANPKGTAMWAFMQRVNAKRGLELSVCDYFLDTLQYLVGGLQRS